MQGSSAPETHLFLRTLDALPAGLAFFSLVETLVSANRPLIRMLNESPDPQRLQQEVRHFVHSLATLVGIRPALRRNEVQELAIRKLRIKSTRYQLRGSFVGFDLFGTGSCSFSSSASRRPCPVGRKFEKRMG